MAGPLDLIPRNDNIVTSKAPTSSVTPQQIASPYYKLAEEMNKVGEIGDNLATQAAEVAGANSVTRDADGTLQVQKQPIVGPASEAFARASRFSYLAQAEPEIENKLAELRLKHPNDPAGFQHAAKVYQEKYLSNVPDGSLKGPAQRIIESNAGQHYRALLNQADQTNVSTTLTSLKSRISDASNKLADLAFQGGTDTKEYQTLQGNVTAMYGELGGDPRMGYPKARIDSELSEMTSQHKVMALGGQAIRMMDGESPTARADAKKFLIDKIYGDSSLNLTMAQRHQAVTTAMGLMEARSAENKALVDANKATANTVISQLHTTQPYDPRTVNDVIQNAAKIGDAETYYKATWAKTMHDWNDTVRGLPLPQQMAAARSLETANITSGSAKQAMDFFVGKGYSREAASGIVGNLIQESNLNPNTVHDNGTGLGIAGHRLERLDALKAYAASKGKPVNDFQTQLEFVDQELNTTEGATGAALKAARSPQEAARAFISFERPQGWTAASPEAGHGFANRVANASALFGGNTGAGAAWFNEARIEQVKRVRDQWSAQAPEMVDTAIRKLNQTGDLSDTEIRQYSMLLAETGRDDLREKLGVALSAHYGVQGVDKLPENVRRSLLVENMPEAAKDNFSFKVHEQMKAQIEANAKAMTETPYTTYAVRTNGKPPAGYNFDDPANVAAVAKSRAGTQAAFTANDRTGPVSVFEGKEAEAFGNVLANGDSGAAAASLQGLSSLPTEIYQATLSQKPVKEAITGMMGSKDPVRMSAAMQAADKFWRDEPAAAKGALGDAAITKLQAWQGLQGSFNPAEIAERLNASDDPSMVKAREIAKDAADKEIKPLTASDVAYRMGTSWGNQLGHGTQALSFIANPVTGATPNSPMKSVDSLQSGELMADYGATYTALRTYGVPKDRASELALERLQSTWGVSQSAGNAVMRNPPEKFYPKINGSHDWIERDVLGEITKDLGPQWGGIGRAGVTNWTVAGLVSDRRTQAEIGAKQPPSYQVWAKRGDGTLYQIPGRIKFDPSSQIAAHTDMLEQRRQTANFLQVGQFGNAGPLP
jgi:hypothetical protein